MRHEPGTAPDRLLLRGLLAALTILALGACAGELQTPGEALRLLNSDLPDAIVEEPYRAQLHAVGGLRPYEYSLASGALPDGLELQGGELRGVPTNTGEFTFGIEVSDANLSKTIEEYGLSVITAPAPALDLQLPATEVRGEVLVRARVRHARGLVGLRTELTWDSDRFTLKEGSVGASRAGLALIDEASPGVLRVDLALLGTTLDGDAELFAFTLVPTEVPTTVGVGSVTEFASDTAAGFRFETATTQLAGAADRTPDPLVGPEFEDEPLEDELAGEPEDEPLDEELEDEPVGEEPTDEEQTEDEP